MRRFIIAAFMALGALGLATGAVSAQYVSPPGQTPSVGSAGFSGESAEVQGESVERDSVRADGSAGLAGSPAEGAAVQSEAGQVGEAGDAAEVAGIETSRADMRQPLEDAELSARTSRSASEGRGGGSLLAFTGLSLGVMMAVGAALLGIGKVLHSFRHRAEA